MSQDRPTTGMPAIIAHFEALKTNEEALATGMPAVVAFLEAREDTLVDALRAQMEVTDELARLAWEGIARSSCRLGYSPCRHCAETLAYLDSVGYGEDVRRERGWQR